MSSTLAEIECLPFAEYQERFVRAVIRQGGQAFQLTNGGWVASMGKGPPMFVVSGIHGDERSGPVALLEYMERNPVPPSLNLWVAPLVNDLGWDLRTREWGDVDLNRSFLPGTTLPPLLGLTELLFDVNPLVYLDLHEDSDVEYGYVFTYQHDLHPLSSLLAQHLQIQEEPWTDAPEWAGSSEVFARRSGVRHGLTLETPPAWSLERRVAMNQDTLNWCFQQTLRIQHESP